MYPVLEKPLVPRTLKAKVRVRAQEELWNGRVFPKRRDEWKNQKEYVLYLRHLKAYDFASRYVKGKSILDVGCGSGYGIAFLSNSSSYAVGIDTSEETIQYCKKRHKRKNLKFKHVETRWIEDGLPFEEGSFDVCVSFQVIEHIHPKNVKGFLSAIREILKEEGLLVISTPNSRLRLLPFQKPWNRFHMKEYDHEELGSLLCGVFPKVEMFGLHATKMAYMIEYKREKQNPLKVYIVRPSYDLLGSLEKLLPFIGTFLKNVEAKRRESKVNKEFVKKDDSFVNLFSLKDFRVVNSAEKDVGNCLDLLCVCHK